MPVTTVLNAIKIRWDANSNLTNLITGGLYLSQIPEKLGSTRIDLPYAYVEMGRTKFEWTMSNLYFEINDVEFCVFMAGSGVNIETALLRVHQAFDWYKLPFDDGSVTTYLMPIDDSITAEPLKYRDGSVVYSARVRYEVWVSRTHSHY